MVLMEAYPIDQSGADQLELKTAFGEALGFGSLMAPKNLMLPWRVVERAIGAALHLSHGAPVSLKTRTNGSSLRKGCSRGVFPLSQLAETRSKRIRAVTV